MFFAIVAVAVTAITSWVAYDRVRLALESEFERRLTQIAGTQAAQIDSSDVTEIIASANQDARLSLETQLITLQHATGVFDAALIDSAGIALLDIRHKESAENRASPLDSLSRGALRRALAGRPSVSDVFRRDGVLLRASFAPVRAGGGSVVGVVAIEAEPAYRSVIESLARTLAILTFISAVAILALAAFIIRAAQSASRLERRLSRVENLAAMGRMTATLAHEIKNPLAIIRGSAERLSKLEPEARRMADFVIEEADRLSNTVARYLQFARGEDEIRDTGDAMAALSATLDLLDGELRMRHVTLDRTGEAPRNPRVPLDNESLKQVYLNLILNALEAMPDGGRLHISHLERQGRIEIGVRDEGSGIAPEILERIGSPFFTTKAKGSGLGLFLTKRLIEACGGSLEIQSQVGRGTTCTVRLPHAKG